MPIANPIAGFQPREYKMATIATIPTKLKAEYLLAFLRLNKILSSAMASFNLLLEDVFLLIMRAKMAA
jgi:hypothetical protein